MATHPVVAMDNVDYSAVKSGGAVHEELLNQLAALDTDARPITDIAATDSTGNVKFEWMEEVLATPTALNAMYDGQREFDNDAKLGLRFANFCQTSGKMVSVGDIANASEVVGGTALATQITNRLRELRNDKEARLASSLAAAPGVSGASGELTAGFGAMVLTGRIEAVDATAPILSDPAGGYVTTAPTGGTARALTLDMIDSAMEGAATRGGRPRYLVTMSPVVKSLTNFLMSGSAQIASMETKINQSERQGVLDGDGLAEGGIAAISAVNVMVMSFGTVTIVPDFQMQFDTGAVTSVLLIDPDWIDCVSLGGTYSISEQGKVGLATDRLLTTSYGLRLPSERAHAVISGIDSTAAVTQ